MSRSIKAASKLMTMAVAAAAAASFMSSYQLTTTPPPFVVSVVSAFDMAANTVAATGRSSRRHGGLFCPPQPRRQNHHRHHGRVGTTRRPSVTRNGNNRGVVPLHVSTNPPVLGGGGGGLIGGDNDEHRGQTQRKKHEGERQKASVAGDEDAGSASQPFFASDSSLATPSSSSSSTTTPSSVFGRPLSDGTKESNKKLVHAVKSILFDVLFAGKGVQRYYARFYALETIARMPYFSYLSVLHLYETLGMWRKAKYLKVHFSQSWNELHHLLIMEELGGDERFADQFVAQHIAFFYYWIVVTLYLYNPTLAYNLNQAVEEEAYETYDNFLSTHREYLRGRSPPDVAVQYYTGDDLYLFDEMHFDKSKSSSLSSMASSVAASAKTPTASGGGEVNKNLRRPKCDTLYDCFVNIRDDEMEHAKTMEYLQEVGDVD